MDFWQIERALAGEGFKLLAGVDEAGRGPLAGPVCAAAVILPEGLEIPGLDDSKKLSAKKREMLFDIILEKALYHGIAFASNAEIDEMNILNATYLAMNRAIEALGVVPDMTVIDGNRNAGIRYPSTAVVGGDGRSANVAAASILAKVTRDRYMTEASAEYPGYGFEKHKGYGTKEHYAALRELGPCPIHRRTFLRKMH